jgi:hypothetical protein
MLGGKDGRAAAMTYKIRYAGGEIEQPDAHTASQQLIYLERDGFTEFSIFDPDGNEITRERLGKLALQSFSAR